MRYIQLKNKTTEEAFEIFSKMLDLKSSMKKAALRDICNYWVKEFIIKKIKGVKYKSVARHPFYSMGHEQNRSIGMMEQVSGMLTGDTKELLDKAIQINQSNYERAYQSVKDDESIEIYHFEFEKR